MSFELVEVEYMIWTGHMSWLKQNMIWIGHFSQLRQNMICIGYLSWLRDMIWIGHLSWYDYYRILFRDVICLGKLILFKGSVYHCFMRVGFICAGMKNRSLQVRFLKSILPAFNR